MVTDSINPPHLYGGVGTAMIFAALLAERTGCELRIITRSDEPHGHNFAHILDLARLVVPSQVEFAYAPYGDDRTHLELGEDEYFLTTSWWTTWGTRAVIDPSRIIYLLQEDERMFYAHGDEHLRCSELLADPQITFLINTRQLYQHFADSGFANIAAHGVWFEPSFPANIFYPEQDSAPRPPYRFFFYARPKHPRNLFLSGLQAIDRALSEGVLDPRTWELCFVGRDIPRLRFAQGLEPRRFENLSWQAYAAFVRKMDLGLCLMYTPHPSYPPLDMAASGAVVVTNRFGNAKQKLDQYSENILCAEPSVDGLVEGIARGVELAQNAEKRRENYQRNRLLRDWRESFAGALDMYAEKLGPILSRDR